MNFLGTHNTLTHHTKDKGDLGLAIVIADLYKNNIKVATNLSEHLPFDCIAISEDGRLLSRLSVKYVSISKVGNLYIKLISNWTDKNGNHRGRSGRGVVDAYGIYCPDNQTCYYVNSSDVSGNSLLLHFNSNHPTAKRAEKFTDPSVIFRHS